MSIKSRQLGQTKSILTFNTGVALTSIPTYPVSAPIGHAVGNINGFKLTEWVSTGEVWRPLGINLSVTVTFTVATPTFTLQKAPFATLAGNTFVSAATGGVATAAGLLLLNGASYIPFTSGTASATTPAALSPYTFAAADAAGDCWRLLISNGVTAGQANIHIHYALFEVAGISDALTTI